MDRKRYGTFHMSQLYSRTKPLPGPELSSVNQQNNDIALNNMIYQGPKSHQNLSEVLLRSGRHALTVVCDIAEMYLQISVAEEGRRYLRFLWRDLNLQETKEIYEFNRIVFGVNSSPFAGLI